MIQRELFLYFEGRHDAKDKSEQMHKRLRVMRLSERWRIEGARKV